jgi:hypothetical protein
VWVINQLSRHEPAAVRSLLDAGEALRKAQERLLQKGGAPDSLRDAMATEREAIRLLTERARSLLESAGRSASPATLERIRQTLQAAAVDDEGRRSLRAGRLTDELEPPGFDAFGGIQVAVRAPSKGADDELAERRRQREERQGQERELQQKARDLERAARDAEREADRAAEAAAEARRVAERARAAADEAAAELAKPH